MWCVTIPFIAGKILTFIGLLRAMYLKHPCVSTIFGQQVLNSCSSYRRAEYELDAQRRGCAMRSL